MNHLGKGNKVGLWINDNPVKTIVILGIFIRLLVAFLYQHITLYPDTADYLYLAERLSNLDLNGYEGQRSPGYPLLLCLAGLSYLITTITQCVVGIFTMVLFYKTMLLTGIDKNISLLVTLITTCYLPIVFFEYAILTESLTLFLITAIFYVFFDEKEKNKIVWLAILGIYLILVKPFYIFLPILLFGALLLKDDSITATFRRYAISLFILPLMIFFGWSYINKINTGYFTSTTFFGFNLTQNCVSFAENTTPEYQEIGSIYAKYRDNRISDKEEAMVIWEAYPEIQDVTGLSYFPDLSNKLYDYSIVTIYENPVPYLKQIFISWRDFWKTSLYWEYDSFAVTCCANHIINYICYVERIILQLIKILFVLFIPYNIIQYFRKRKVSPELVISCVVFSASVLQALVTYGTNSRFSYPFELLIIMSMTLNSISIYRVYYSKYMFKKS